MTLTFADARQLVLDALGDIAPEIDPLSVSGTASLADLDLDSMDVLDLLVAIEQHTGRTIPEGAMRTEWGIEALADYLVTESSREDT